MKAELTGASSLTMPENLKASGIEHATVTGIWNSQIHQFARRVAALAGQRSVIKEKIAQLEAQLARRPTSARTAMFTNAPDLYGRYLLSAS